MGVIRQINCGGAYICEEVLGMIYRSFFVLKPSTKGRKKFATKSGIK